MSAHAFDKIMAGLEQAVEIVGGEADPASYVAHVPREIDVKAVRQRLNLNQTRLKPPDLPLPASPSP